MKYKSLLFIIIFFTCFSGGFLLCKYTFHRCNNVIDFSHEDSVKTAVLINGDTSAYNELKTICNSAGRPYDIFYHALVMANRHNYTPANLDVYKSLTQVYDSFPNLGKMDRLTDSLRFVYYNRAKERK